MFCSNCGNKADGNFCSGCGARLAQVAPVQAVPAEVEPAQVVLAQLAKGPPPLPPDWRDWQDEIRYDALLQYSEVRDLLAKHAARAHKGVSAEQFLELCDKVIKPFGGVSMVTVMIITRPIYARLGIRTGKTRQERLAEPAGKILVAALCSLARHGWALKHVHQGEDGCVLEAVLPSDLRSSEGEVIVTVRRDRSKTHVDAVTKIPGQLFDWGKSNQCLKEFFGDLATLIQ